MNWAAQSAYTTGPPAFPPETIFGPPPAFPPETIFGPPPAFPSDTSLSSSSSTPSPAPAPSPSTASAVACSGTQAGQTVSVTSTNQLLPMALAGDYTVVKVLGKGSFGEVYEVTKDGLPYAVKKVDGSDRTAATELAFATSISPTMNSPFLVRYYESIRGSLNELYVVMELCIQGDLKSLLNRIRTLGNDAILNPTRIIKILIQLLLGLDVLHRHRIIHRDLKPDNVFVDAQDNVKIGDFGCARMLQSLTEQANTHIGTPYYESPEVFKGKGYAFSSDMWSLGVVLYELCTLQRPFTGSNIYAVMQKIMVGEYKPIPKRRVPDQVRDIVDSLLNLNPNERPSAPALLQHPFIRECAVELNLLDFFPPITGSA